MNKKLENEYQKLMNNEVPDLWARIESGIDQRLVAKEDSQGIELQEKEPSRVVETKRKKFAWRKYSIPIAACVAGIICVPLALSGLFVGGRSKDAAVTESVLDSAHNESSQMQSAVTTDGATEEEKEEEAEAEVEMQDEVVVEDMAAEMAQEECKQSVNQENFVLTVTAIYEVEEKYCISTHEEGECLLLVDEEIALQIAENAECKIVVAQDTDTGDYYFVRFE